jgi:hypothetical protein
MIEDEKHGSVQTEQTPPAKMSSASIILIQSSTITITKMKRIIQFSILDSSKAIRSCQTSAQLAQRCLHTSTPNPATVAPITASGPPPTAPIPSAEHVDSRVARRRKQADLLKKGQDLRTVASGKGGGTAKMKRFWMDVHVKEVDGMNLIFSSLHKRLFDASYNFWITC